MTDGETGVRVADAPGEREDAFGVRYDVFVEEQGISEELEYDDQEDESVHFVAYDGERPVGAARLRSVDGVAKIERVAVLADARGEGWGARLMDAAESAARDREMERAELHAQTRVAAFYDRLGYECVGEKFEEAGIPHVRMVKGLEP